MTNEEIESCIQTLRFLENTFLDDHGIFLNDKHPDNIEKIITFLHESLCEDCISKEGLINELKLGYFNKELQEGKNDPCVIDAMVDWAIRAVKHQPPITPSRPKGKWIVLREEYEFMGGIVNEARGCKCSNCNKVVRFKSVFCPNCGADMRESEGKE